METSVNGLFRLPYFLARAFAAICAVVLLSVSGGSATAGYAATGVWSASVHQHLYVSDPGAGTILRFVLRHGIPDQRPDAEIGGLSLPRGIAIGPDSRLYVLDAALRELLIYEPSPGTGSKPSHVLSLPHSWGLGTVGVDPDGFVYVGYLIPCGYLGPCGLADVYTPLPSGKQKPIATYSLGGSPPTPFVSGLVINATHHFAAVAAGQPDIYSDAPKQPKQTPYFLFCPPASFGAAWGQGNALYTTDLGQPSNPPTPPTIHVIPDYLHGNIPNCPTYYTITSATVPLDRPFGITQQAGLLYVTSMFNPTVRSGLVFVFDSTKAGAQTPLAILGGRGSELRKPWGVAIGP